VNQEAEMPVLYATTRPRAPADRAASARRPDPIETFAVGPSLLR
jgi:hypothetical protein